MTSTLADLIEELAVPLDDQLLDLALTHRSWAYENGGVPTNERLEFLGDAVLGVNVTEYLYSSQPDRPEGQLAKLRAACVNAFTLGDVARGLELGSLVKLGRGEVSTGGHDKTSILADTLEAVIGACHLCSPAGAKRFVHHLFDPLVDRAATLGAGLDWKTSLQEICAARGAGQPVYQIEESGPDHDKRFTAQVLIDGLGFDIGHGHNKKQAEQQAAAAAFHTLQAEVVAVRSDEA